MDYKSDDRIDQNESSHNIISDKVIDANQNYYYDL